MAEKWLEMVVKLQFSCLKFWRPVSSCKRPTFLSSFSRLQVIQNKRPWCSAAVYVTARLLSFTLTFIAGCLIRILTTSIFLYGVLMGSKQFSFSFLSYFGIFFLYSGYNIKLYLKNKFLKDNKFLQIRCKKYDISKETGM